MIQYRADYVQKEAKKYLQSKANKEKFKKFPKKIFEKQKLEKKIIFCHDDEAVGSWKL